MPVMPRICPSEGHTFVCEGQLLSTRTIFIRTNEELLEYHEMLELVPGSAPGTWIWQEVPLH